MAEPALAGWGELLPLLVFIILGWLANRAKQKKEAEALGNPGQPKPSVPAPAKDGRPVPARREPGSQGPHTFEDGEDVEDWTGEDWDGEHSERWDDRRSGEVRSEQPRPMEDRVERLRPAPAARPPEAQRHVPSDRGEEKPPAVPNKAKEKAAEVGKDILSQLAKELGLELPKPQPRPAPKPAPAQPPQGKPSLPKPPAHAHVPKSQGISSDEVRARAAEANRSQARPSPASVAPVAAPIAQPLISASEIASAQAMRKAFVLKTLLDKPLSRKPRRPGFD